MQTRIGTIYEKLSARGIPSYSLELWHDGLNKHRVIRGESVAIVKMKASLQVSEWDERWEIVEERRQQKSSREARKLLLEENKSIAAERTLEAQQEIKAVSGVLEAALDVQGAIDWESIKDKTPFPELKPTPPLLPDEPKMAKLPSEPTRQDSKYIPKIGILEWLIPSRKIRAVEAAEELFCSDHKNWSEQVAVARRSYASALHDYERTVADKKFAHDEAVNKWIARLNQYNVEKAKEHAEVDAKRASYESGDPEAIIEYCDLVLSCSQYPACFPQEFDLDYDASAKTLVVDYRLPAPDDMPRLKGVKFVPSRDEFDEQYLSASQVAKLYDDVLYQVTLRTIHELYEADCVGALRSVVFNGIVTSVDRATGKSVASCVLSLRANLDEFIQINLKMVEPKACFKSLKGVGSSKLHGLAAVAPIMQLGREDRRFVSSYKVVCALEDGVNLAAIGWEDFEHLIRELFEKEFSTNGCEVKVTQASRDGGVDAVAFDPDPIRGGKIVIQAKRYTNTVGVGAVRDLYGTVMNEGANKGILVTTSDYGPDSYAFANGKPLVLLNGSNLLHMLQKHGHKARIDLREAKMLLSG